jgi:hypothetical protein
VLIVPLSRRPTGSCRDDTDAARVTFDLKPGQICGDNHNTIYPGAARDGEDALVLHRVTMGC